MPDADAPLLLDFEGLFTGLPALYLILDPALRIIAVTDGYLRATMTRREAILGKGIFEVFPDNPEEATATGTTNLGGSLRRVLQTREPDVMAVQKYDIPRRGPGESGFEERYWSPINSPILDQSGQVQWIVHRVEDITDYVQQGLQGTNKDEMEVFLRAQEVQNANERLRQVDRERSAFLAHMSHEIRTPLATILGLSQLAQRHHPSGKIQEYLEKIQTAGHTLTSLVNNILDLSRIESGRWELDSGPLNLHELVRSVRLLFEERARAKGLTFRVVCPSEIPGQLLGDSQRLSQVLTNLVGNAIKFTESGRVTLELSVVGPISQRPLVRFTVRDTGIGITSAQSEHLFEAFYQGDQSMRRRFGGTGLGLAISQRFVQAMGGTIEVASTPGEGSRFEFTIGLPIDKERRSSSVIPVALNQLPTLVVVSPDQRRREVEGLLANFPFQREFWNPSADQAPGPIPGPPHRLVIIDPEEPGTSEWAALEGLAAQDPKPVILVLSKNAAPEREETLLGLGADAVLKRLPSASSMTDLLLHLLSPPWEPGNPDEAPSEFEGRFRGFRVLVAEDNQTNRDILTELLEFVGVRVVAVQNGVEAVDTVLRSPPRTYSLILMDIQMPLMDGYEATRKIHTHPGYADLPIVALTAHALSEERKLSLDVGMVDHLTKPFVPEALYQALADWGTATAAATLNAEDGLARVLHNQAFHRRLLKNFLGSCQESLATTETLVSLGDWETARAQAHTLKGQAQNLGLEAVAGEAEAIERLVRSGQQLSTVHLKRLGDALDEAVLAIENYLAGVDEGTLVPPGEPDREDNLESRFRALLEEQDTEALILARDHQDYLCKRLGERRAQDLDEALRSFSFPEALRVWEEGQ